MAVLFVIGIIITALGLNQPGTGIMPMILIAGVMGMAGSFISLLTSKKMAMRSSGAVVIHSPSNDTEAWLVDTVHRQADEAGIGHPDVAIFDSSAPNAFATGANKDASLVAVSTALLDTMDQDEVEAVLAHEVSHIANGDMVTLSLIQGVVNTFVIVFSQLISAMLDRRRNGGYSRSGYGYGRGIGYRTTYMLAQTVLGFLATLIVRWFSRWREYRADAGGAQLAGREKMIRALQRLQSLQQPAQLPAQMQALGINGGLLGAIGLKKLTMTHPPLEERIAALRNAA
ncbi:MAG: protease HtpX [Acidiferrobacterales bacterium]|nr:protease HtpX [Acidiferrobacterales bacterium]